MTVGNSLNVRLLLHDPEGLDPPTVMEIWMDEATRLLQSSAYG